MTSITIKVMIFTLLKMKNGKQILLPGIKDVIKQIDIENEKIIVHLLNGLI